VNVDHTFISKLSITLDTDAEEKSINFYGIFTAFVIVSSYADIDGYKPDLLMHFYSDGEDSDILEILLATAFYTIFRTFAVCCTGTNCVH